MRFHVVVDENKVIRRLSPDQGARIPRVVAHPEHSQVEQRSHSVQRGEVEREGRDAQSLKGAGAGIENI